MFFFFFIENESQIIKKCLNIYFQDRMGTNRYCDVSELFSDDINKSGLKNSFGTQYGELKNLYRHNYPTDKKELNILTDIYIDRIDDISEPCEAFAILFWCFKIFRR